MPVCYDSARRVRLGGDTCVDHCVREAHIQVAESERASERVSKSAGVCQVKCAGVCDWSWAARCGGWRHLHVPAHLHTVHGWRHHAAPTGPHLFACQHRQSTIYTGVKINTPLGIIDFSYRYLHVTGFWLVENQSVTASCSSLDI